MAEGHNEIPTSSDNIASMFDIYLYGVELKDELFLGFTYAQALFRGETVETFIQYFQEILDSVIKDEKVLIKDIAISHKLGIARINVLDDDEDFGF